MSAGERHGATDPFEHHAGAYVLGALSEQDTADFAVHLERCPACARSVADLAHLPGLLDRVPPDQIRRLAARREHDDDPSEPEDDLGPPPSLLPELLQRAGEVSTAVQRRRRRWRVAAGMAAAAAVAAVAVVAVEERAGDVQTPQARPTTQQPVTPTASEVVLRPVGRQSITAAVHMESVAWGTRIELTCAYASAAGPYQPGSGYALVVSDVTGKPQQVATWRGVAGRTLTVPAATSLQRTGISRVEVVRADGQVVLSAAP